VVTRASIAAALLAPVLGGCYSPQLQDCSVTCEAAGDCASGQVCDEGGWCTAPDQIGTCPERPDRMDAGVDADPTIDAPSDGGLTAALRILITGRGRVLVDPAGVECERFASGEGGDCTFLVPASEPQTLTAERSHPSSPFAGWTTENCLGQDTVCTVTVNPPGVLVSASFN